MNPAELEKKIGYSFNNKELLLNALTHSSYANEHSVHEMCNERLEFLGDSVLGFITAEYYYAFFSHRPEGELTKLRAQTVCEKSLFAFAKQINLGSFLRLGKGEIATGGADRPSIVSDGFEALIAAIYLDGGMDAAKDFVLRFLKTASNVTEEVRDYKTILQEIVQKNPGEELTYVHIGESGPDHDKRFEVEVHLNSNIIGKGIGRSKKAAEQAAAKEALSLMGL
ncbi:MAG: ribonuclease III [Clostridia bacterium]|nr:ribonuclease III [Clostridia bacterium]